MRRAEGGAPRLAVGAALGAGFAAALFTVAGVIMSTVALVGVPNIGTRATQFFYLLFNGLGSAGTIALALFVGAFSTVIIETGVLPRVMGWLGALLALDLIAAGGGHRVDARDLLRSRLHRIRRPLTLGHRRQRADVPGRGRELRGAGLSVVAHGQRGSCGRAMPRDACLRRH